jgi:hypothetical protein
MKLTQADYDERKQRQNDGLADDDDRRLIKMYEAEGFEQSRLKRERAARAAAREARAGLSAAGLAEAEAGEGTQEGDGLPKVTQRDNRDDWVAFANAINARLAEDERPVPVPAEATKADLVAGYKNWATGAGAPATE